MEVSRQIQDKGINNFTFEILEIVKDEEAFIVSFISDFINIRHHFTPLKRVRGWALRLERLKSTDFILYMRAYILVSTPSKESLL